MRPAMPASKCFQRIGNGPVVMPFSGSILTDTLVNHSRIVTVASAVVWSSPQEFKLSQLQAGLLYVFAKTTT